MKPRFAAVAAGYPTSPPHDTAALFSIIGWEDLVTNGNYENTCAIRVSIALASAGVRIPGRMSIRKGTLKGRLIEPGQARLSMILARRNMLGAPEKFKGSPAAERGIGMRCGIVSFWRLYPTRVGDNQGHIDVVSPNEYNFLTCKGHCYFGAAEIWFWPLR
ncbi:T6SS effector amidase Tae4 family protein [Massilia sp. TWR1-2-2]|uniref:T6SS effector amidase Tae4 family protein n=1 Tax=Massilia sp. TWR1-2-2 TaxID=2804584 RepID=UPI003CEAF383